MNQPATKLRPSTLAFVLPFVMGVILAVIVGGLAIAGYVGRDATGERLTVVFETGCGEAWRPIIQQRVDTIGLVEPALTVEGDRLTLTAQFPGLEDDATAIPALLIKPGELGVFVEGDVEWEPTGESLASTADVTDARLTLDIRARSVVEITLEKEARARVHEAIRAGPVLYVIDGEVVERYVDKRGMKAMHIDVFPERETLEEEIRVATDLSIIMQHGPAPCEATVASVTPADGAS